MPTDLPPDYKPRPVKPGEGKPAPEPPAGGEDVKGHQPPGAKPGPRGGLPGDAGDVVDPTGWKGPGDGEPAGVPTPAGTPTF